MPLAVLPDNLLTSAQQQNAGLGETNEPRVTKPKEFSRGFYDFAHNFTKSKLTRLDSTRYRDWLRSSLPTTLQVSLNQYFRVRWLITQICLKNLHLLQAVSHFPEGKRRSTTDFALNLKLGTTKSHVLTL